MRRRTSRWGALASCSSLLSCPTLGATLSSESSVGLSSQYASNPLLVSSGAHAAESAALLADLPVTYASDSQSIELDPKARAAATHGDVALLSDYQYLDGIYKLSSERNTYLAAVAWHRDSTLYNTFENAALQGLDLRRLEETANLDWQRALSERSDVQLVASWDHVSYSHNSSVSLDNYNYGQASAQYDRDLNERWKWTTVVGFGRYELLDHSYATESRFAQTSLIRPLSERWSLTAQVGYADLSATEQGYVCCEILQGTTGYYLQYIPVEQRASRGSPNFALSLERKSERLLLDFAASRAIQPSGLGALLTQDDVSLNASIPWTEGLTLGAKLHGSRLTDSLELQSRLVNRRYYDEDLSASWLWTEHWILGVQASYVQQRSSALALVGSGVTVALNLSRQFGRLRL